MRKKEVFIIISILMIGLILYGIVNFNHIKGNKCIVYINNTEYLEIDLTINNDYNINELLDINVKDGEVNVVKSNCKNQVCVHHKSISYNNESIVCLPQNIIIKIESSNNNNIDVITN